VASVWHLAPVHLGLDVHKDTISVGILRSGQQVPDVERIANDEPSVRRLVARFDDPRLLASLLRGRPDRVRAGPAVAQHGGQLPGDRPIADPGDKIKTDKRDCRRLARLHRAGELVCIGIPTVDEEAVRDLCCTRADMVEDLTRARNRLGKFLLCHGRPWRGGSTPDPHLPGVAAQRGRVRALVWSGADPRLIRQDHPTSAEPWRQPRGELGVVPDRGRPHGLAPTHLRLREAADRPGQDQGRDHPLLEALYRPRALRCLDRFDRLTSHKSIRIARLDPSAAVRQRAAD
jgi:hypothetical protein